MAGVTMKRKFILYSIAIFWLLAIGGARAQDDTPFTMKLTISSEELSWDKLQQILAPELVEQLRNIRLSGTGSLTLHVTGSLDALNVAGLIDATHGDFAVERVISKPKDVPGVVEFEVNIADTGVDIERVQVNVNEVYFDVTGEIVNPLPPSGLRIIPTFLPVPAGQYEISKYLRRFMQYAGQEPVVVEFPFSIQIAEVTVGEFRKYAQSLNAAAQSRIGTRWDTGLDAMPVENIRWQDAAGYAAWLSQQTGLRLQLPTVQQWMAACTQYAEPDPILQTASEQPLAGIRDGRDIDHLLGNLREWSATSCGNGKAQLLGENYMADPDSPETIGQTNCVNDSAWSGVGFRLVRMP